MASNMGQWRAQRDEERCKRLYGEGRVRCVRLTPEAVLLFIRSGIHEIEGVPRDAAFLESAWDEASRQLWIYIGDESFPPNLHRLEDQPINWQRHICPPAQQPVKFREFF